MLSLERLKIAGELVEWLRLAVHEQSLLASNRTRASASCYGIAQEHHHAIVLLAHHRLYASCYSLLRVEFEAYVRGLWLGLCASDSEVEGFLSGVEPPKIRLLLDAIESTPAFTAKTLSTIKSQSWNAMCAYTHTGGLHVQRWNTSEAIEPNYEPKEVEEVLRFAELIAAMSVIGIAQLAGNDELGMRVLTKMQEIGDACADRGDAGKK